MKGLMIEDAKRIGVLLEKLQLAERISGLIILVDGLEIWDEGELIATLEMSQGELRVVAKL